MGPCSSLLQATRIATPLVEMQPQSARSLLQSAPVREPAVTLLQRTWSQYSGIPAQGHLFTGLGYPCDLCFLFNLGVNFGHLRDSKELLDDV